MATVQFVTELFRAAGQAIALALLILELAHKANRRS